MCDTLGHDGRIKVMFLDIHRKMVHIAKKLSSPFSSVQVDFYSCNDRLVLGEFIFFDG